jgi:hypothetical protein
MAFLKFIRVLVGATVVWLLLRLLLSGRDGKPRTTRRTRAKPHRRGTGKFIESTVVDPDDQP